MKHVCYFRHALALDERRVKFLPEYAYGGRTKLLPKPEKKKVSPGDHESPSKGTKPSTRDADARDPITESEPSGDRAPIDNKVLGARLSSKIKSVEKRPHTVEVWFAGTHSDM